MKHKILSVVLIVIFLVICADLLTLNSRVKDYLMESMGYDENCQVYVKYSDDAYHIYESPEVDGFKVVKFGELPKSMYYKVKVMDFLVEQSSNVIIL